MDKVLILGAYGYLGNALTKFLRENNIIVFRQGRSPNSEYVCDPNDRYKLNDLIDNLNPTSIINLIAETNVEKCEFSFLEAFQTNCTILENIIFSLKEKKTFLIHISTDQVYSGEGPHFETFAKPINSYAITKYMSEIIALKYGALVLRTNFVGKSKSNKLSFTDWPISSFLKNEEISLFNDVYFSPVHISFLTKVIKLGLEKKNVGLFNLGSENGISKFDFIKNITKDLNLVNNKMKIISVDDFSFKAKRPKDMVLNSKKFEETFHIKVPSIERTLELVVKDYK